MSFLLGFLVPVGKMAAAVEGACHSSEIYRHLIANDEEACRRYVERACHGDSSVLAICEALTEAFHLVGEAWACEETTTYREHVASQIGYRLLMDLRTRLSEPQNTALNAIGCTPENDPYSLPTMMIEVVLRDLGWQARSLGSNLPLEMLAPALDEVQPKICWVSVSYIDSMDRLCEQLSFLGDFAERRGVKVLCGGQAIDHELVERVDRVTFLSDLRELIRIVDVSESADN